MLSVAKHLCRFFGWLSKEAAEMLRYAQHDTRELFTYNNL